MRLDPLRNTMSACLLMLASCCFVQNAAAQAPVQTSFVFINETPTYVDTVTGVLSIAGTAAIPAGSVSYQVDGGATLTASLDAQGQAWLNIAPQKPGSHTVTWTYSGDGGNQGTSGSSTYTTTDLPAAVVGSSYPLRPLIYSQVEGNGYGSYGASGVVVDGLGNTFLSFGNSVTGVAPSVAEITEGLDYKVLPISGIGTDTQLAIDAAGNLYIADPTHSRIVEYTAGGVQQILGVSGLQTPVSLTYEASSNSLYIMDHGVGAVINYDLTHSTQSTLFKAAGMDTPIATDGQGDVYYGQGPHLYLWSHTNQTREIFTQFIPPSDSSGSDVMIQGLASDVNRGVLWVAIAGPTYGMYAFDAHNHLLAYINDSGQRSDGSSDQIAVDADGHAYGTEDVFTLGSAINGGPGAYVQPNGEVFFSTPYATANSTVVVQAYGSMQTENPEPDGMGLGTASWPYSLSIPGTAQALNVPVYGKGYGVWNAATPGSTASLQVTLSQPGGIANVNPFVGKGDNLYVTDTAKNTVTLIRWAPAQGGPSVYKNQTLSFTGLQQPTQVAADGANDVWVMDKGGADGGARIVELNNAGVQSVVYSSASSGTGVATMTAFAQYGNSLYVAGSNSRGGVIEQFDGIGVMKIIAVNIVAPVALAADADENVYAVDAGGTLIRVDRTGKVTTVASSLPAPTQLSVLPDGTVYLSGATASDVLMIAPDGTQTHLAIPGTTNPAYAVTDGMGNISFIDGSSNTVNLNTRSAYVEQDFGTTALNTTGKIDFTITNVGNLTVGTLGPNNVAPFTLVGGGTSPCVLSGMASLSPGQSCGLEMQYVPTKQQTDSAQIYLAAQVSGVAHCCDILSDIFDVTGKGGTATAAPNPVLTPASIDFGDVTVNTTTEAKVAKLSNTGTAPLTISSFGFFGPNTDSFNQTNNCGATLAAGASCSITILCTPNASGALSASLGVNFPSPLPQQSVALSCTGTAAAAQVTLTPPSYDFGTLNVGVSSLSAVFTLTKTGDAEVTLSQIQIIGPNASDFVILGGSCSPHEAVAPRVPRAPMRARTHVFIGAEDGSNQTCSIVVAFTPSATRAETATLSVTDSVGTQTSALSGTGAGTVSAPQAALTPAKADFANVTIGSSSAAQTFILSNAGNAALPITSISVTGANASSFIIISKTCGNSLNAGASCTIAIAFAPSATGSLSAELSVVDSVGTQASNLSGTGVALIPPDFTITATPGAQSTYLGTSVQYTVQLTSAKADNPFTEAVTLSAAGLPDGASASFAPASVVPGTTTPFNSTLTITIPAPSASRSGTPPGAIPGAASLACLGFAWLLRRRAKGLAICAFLVLLGAATALTGCSNSRTGFAVRTTTSTITVTGTSGSIAHSTTVTLTTR